MWKHFICKEVFMYFADNLVKRASFNSGVDEDDFYSLPRHTHNLHLFYINVLLIT